MSATEAELQRVLAPLEGPLRFASKSERALSSLRGLDVLAAQVAVEARRLGLSGAQEGALDRLVLRAGSFETQELEGRRRLLPELAAELARLLGAPRPALPGPAAPAGASEEAEENARRRARSLSVEGALAPVAVEGDALARPLSALKGIGPAVSLKLAARGLHSFADALLFLPRAYEDRRAPVAIARAKAGEHVVVVARVVRFEERFARKRLYELTVADDTGALVARWFGFRPGAYRSFVEGTPLVLSGELRQGRHGRLELIHPDLEVGDASEDPASFGHIIPVYSEIEGVSARAWRRIARRVVEEASGEVRDYWPEAMRARHRLPPLGSALAQVHFPPDDTDPKLLARFASAPQRRLVFDELFFVQLGLALRKRGVEVERGFALVADERVLSRAVARLPFTLTGAQRRALEQIAGDLSRPVPMNRLLQGDVGSGKTAVALASALVAVENGYQAALMAPTEILAEQHARSFQRLLGGDLFGKRSGHAPVAVTLLTSGLGTREHRRALNEVASGTARIVVGTHALLSEGVEYQRLGLVIVDEQHRFGVMQRARLISKGERPHVLVMTATPIPRTLALTLYGDLDNSVIDELPPGRTPVTTRLFGGKQRSRAYDLVRKEVQSGRQAYVVLPLVEESEKLDLRSATEEAERLGREDLSGLRIGLLHGRMAADERNRTMEEFRRGALQVLVATTVIEVGVDVPNASVMVVEHAERFGLSQLHQLRGRVGRGAAKSHCLLVAEHLNGDARDRLEVMVKTTDGFKLAEEDLRIRGPGELLGTRQSGLPDFVVADLLRDQAILSEAREAAKALVEADPDLARPEHRPLVVELERRWAGKLSLARIG